MAWQPNSRNVNRITAIHFQRYRFLIMDSPTSGNVAQYVAALKRKGCDLVVRNCEATYGAYEFEKMGIQVIDLPFSDGSFPDDATIARWLQLVRAHFAPMSIAKYPTDKKQPPSPQPFVEKSGTRVSSSTAYGAVPTTSLTRQSSAGEDATSENSKTDRAIAVHCIAGLGRAPVLVAIALIESGMSAVDAINYVRKKRRGAINHHQIQCLEHYRPSGSLLASCLTCVVL